MKWRLSHSALVASLLTALISATVTASREPASSIDDETSSVTRGRGSSRFSYNPIPDAVSVEGVSTVPTVRRTGSSLRRTSKPGTGLESRRSSRPEAGLEASSAKATVVASKDSGRRQVADSGNGGIRPEESVLGAGDFEAKNNARRNTRVSKDEEVTAGHSTEDRRYLPERRTRLRTEDSFADVGLETPKETPERSRGIERRVSRSRSDAAGGEKTLPKTPGPSVFAHNVEYSRSRTGRKIQNPSSQLRRSEEKGGDRFGRLESGAEKVEAPKGRPVSRIRVKNFNVTVAPEPLEDAGSVRVDIPLTIDRTESLSTSTESTTAEAFQQSQSVTFEPSTTTGRSRSRSRQGSVIDRSPESSISGSRSSGRRGGSRFSETGDVVSSSTRSRDGSGRGGANSRSTNDSAKRSRTSDRQADAVEDGSKLRGGRGRGRKIERLENVEESSKTFSSRGREPEKRTRVVETRSRNPDGEVERANTRSGGRSGTTRNGEATLSTSTTTLPTVATEKPALTVKSIELEATEQPEVAIQAQATTPAAVIFERPEPTTRAPEVKPKTRNSRGRARSSTEGRRSNEQREADRSNDGEKRLPRKRKIAQTEVTSRNEAVGRGRGSTTTDATVKESFAPKLLRRPKIEGAKVAETGEISAAAIVDSDRENSSRKDVPGDDLEVKKMKTVNSEGGSGSTTPRISELEKISQRRGLKRLKIRPRDEREELSTASSLNSEITLEEAGKGRRGGKSNRNSEDNDAVKPIVEATEEDNYPPDFKARLAQLKNSGSKISAVSKSTPRLVVVGIQSNNFKKPSPVLFSTSARLKLEKAKKLVHPAADSQENELDVESATTPAVVATTQLSAPRKSLFGKRPGLARPSPATRAEDIRGAVKTSVDDESSSGKMKKAEKMEVKAKTPLSDGIAVQVLRPVKQRPNFTRRRSIPTTESITESNVATTSEQTSIASDSKTLRADENSVSKYVRAGRISRNGEKPTPGADSPRDLVESSVPRKSFFTKRLNQRSTDIPRALKSEPTTTVKPAPRYTRRKVETKVFRKFDSGPKPTDETETTNLARREFRPRTATYRRHSEAPPSPAGLAISSTNAGPISIAITPKTPKFPDVFSSDASLPTTNAKTVNVRITEDLNGADNPASLTSNGSGIVGSSNGETGNGATNVFSPTRTLQFMNGNTSFLQQLRSTVAPLLSSLGLKSPVFEGAYSNTTRSGNSAMRVTPSGQPPRFSARYKGAELFVRRPTNGYQPTVPSVISSTTPLTPFQVSGVPSPLDVSSPGEPQVLTFYQALETASINNEQRTDVQRPVEVGQVVNDNARDINDTNNTNIDTDASPADVNTRFRGTVTSPDTSDITTVSMEPETTQNPLTSTQLPDATTVASLDTPETQPSTPQPDAILESTSNPVTTAEAATESVQRETSPASSEATSQPSDIPSTTLASDTNANFTPLPDTTLASDLEETSSPQSSEPFERLTDATTVPSLAGSTSPQNNEITTNIPVTTESQQSSSETSQDASTDSPRASTLSSDVQTTQISETTSVPLLRIDMQVDTDASTPSAAPETTTLSQVTPNLSSESPDITLPTTTVVDTTQTTSSILARLSDSEIPDVTTVASSTQEPTTPSSLDITASFGATTTVSQVTNQPDTEVTTESISVELETGEVTSTQSVTRADTATTTTTTPEITTLQTFGRISEQGTESVNADTQVTESDASGSSTVSNEFGSLTTATDTPTQSNTEANTATTTPLDTSMRIGESEPERVDEDASVTESDLSSSIANNQVGSVETVTSTQSVTQSDTATTTTPELTTLQTFGRISEQETESVNAGISVTESEAADGPVSIDLGYLPVTIETTTQSNSEEGTVATTPLETLLRIAEPEAESVDNNASVTESDGSSSTASNQVGSIESETTEVTSTQSDTATTTPATLTSQFFDRIVEQNTESVNIDSSVTESEASGSTVSNEFGSLTVATDTPTQSNSETGTVTTTPLETLLQIGGSEQTIIDGDVPVTESATSSSIASDQVGSIESETTEAIFTQSVTRSDTPTTTTTSPELTTLQTFGRISEQNTESVTVDMSVTESDASGSTVSIEFGSLTLATDTPTQSNTEANTAATTPLDTSVRIGDLEPERVDEDAPVTESDVRSSTANNQVESIETVTSTQSVTQSDTATTTTTSTPEFTTLQTFGRILEQETESLNAVMSSTESEDANGPVSIGLGYSSVATDTTTQSNGRFDTTETTTVTPSTDVGLSEDSIASTTATSIDVSATVSDSNDSPFATTVETSLARVSENFETLPTVVPDTTTVAIGEETTTSVPLLVTTETSSDSSSQLLGGFIDNRVIAGTSTEETATTATTATQSTERVFPSETTTPFESLVDPATTLSNVPATRNDEVVETTTQDLTLTTSTLPTIETTLANDAIPPNGETQTNDATELTTNRSTINEVTTESISETSTTPEPTPNLVTDTPTLLARLQDVTATTTATVTAQGTAGVDVQATTRPNEISDNPPETTPLPTTQAPTTPASQESNDVSTSDTNSPLTTTTNLPDANEPTTVSLRSSADLTASTEEIPSVTSTASGPTTTAATPETTFGIEENLISTNAETTSFSGDFATTEAIQTRGEFDETATTSTEQTITTQANVDATTVAASSTPPQVSSFDAPVITDAPMIQQNRANVADIQGRGNLFVPTPMPEYVGRFGGTRLTPAPRFSPSSSTRAPLRDYFVYGIYPNKTIVRKRPEDNIIDGRNVDSPYVIFGIYPNGKLVRKFPNGTVIPDPPRNPVEVVFSLSTTTTNRPSPVFYNQAHNTGYYNQITPIYHNRPVASIFNQNANRFPGGNVGLAGNTITGNGGGFSGFPSIATPTRKMSDVLLETQMGTRSNTLSEIGDLLTPSTPGTPFLVTPSNFGSNLNLQGGGRISQERESNEASRTRGTNGQRSSVYIGQEKFINYWSDSSPSTSPRVISVRINSVAGTSNVAPASASGAALPSLDILPGAQSEDTAARPAGFPWADPLDEILGVTTNSPVITASVGTNTLEDSGSGTIVPRPINPFVEVFTPGSSAIDTTVSASTSAAPSAELRNAASATTSAPPTTTTTTTTPAPPTTTTTTTTTTSTTTTPAPTTTTTTTTTTTPVPTSTTTTTTEASTGTTEFNLPSTESPPIGAANFPQQAVFGNTFDDLAFLNALLHQADASSPTKRTLTDAEQFLADKILSLALENVGPTRSAKAIQPSNASPNSFDLSSDSKSSSRPIVIDLLSPSTTQTPRPTQPSTQFTWKPITTSTQRPAQATWKPVPVAQTTTSKQIDTTLRPATPTILNRRPNPTVAPSSQGFGASILSALFGSNPFAAPSPTPTPARNGNPVEITPKPKPKPATTTTSTTTTTTSTTTTTTTPRSRATDPVQAGSSKVSASTPQPVTNGIAVLLNNPNPRVPTLPSSTFSPDDDAKFLAALLNSGQLGGASSVVSKDDQAFLRAILNGQASVKAASPIEAGSNSGGNDAALLAALLQAQGVGPSTPANNLRAEMAKTVTKSPPQRASTTASWSPSSTYPPSIFESFGGFGGQRNGDDSGSAVAAIPGDGTVRSQVVNAAIGATKAFSRFLGAAFTGAAQQFQSFVRNGTRYVSEAVG